MFARSAQILALTLMIPVAALASDGKPSAEVEAQIRATLTEQGYEVRKIETEDGLYEAYAIKDGKKLEIYMNDKMEIIRIKED
ncbi:PepSY domain-containing protein [Phaeobacter sp. QD34_3]|uniref:PepSY domain-containing protein n=1 Tax=unclassified Phaeobacter TaxID=2621772 RepID=UPI00237FA0B8|nr:MULTISPECIES: PepSY domain-containing protein [unclassified Phaeobacter]MDE4133302.1 PepSY domain-containing protein [Phaeobacter sp. QD34_3]MDE4136911.1 PepSY domain-containing protein [Phaeobacter sp. QD34_24]